MKTKVEKALKYLAISAFLFALAINMKVSLSDSVVFTSDNAIAVETSTTKICKRIKTFCSCKDEDGTWQAMSILECESYQWSIPMVCTTCIPTKCPEGSACTN